jgi:DNA processing protein
MRDELAAWLRLLGAPGVGRLRARKLLQHHGSLAAAAASQPDQTETAALLTRSWDWLQADPLRSLLCLGDADYPEALLQSPDPPLLLFLEGQREQLARLPAIAVVGSRHPTPQGRDTAYQFAAELAAAGYAVVSGLAIGIDGEAHQGALSRGASWAVLGSGLDQIHPRRHQELALQLRERGLLISEHPPGTAPLPQHFPVRNRIIAGLSRGCLVVEAAEASGSLITARLAAEAGRDVYAVPGSIRSLQSRGCHQLIQQGAMLVQQPDDLLPDLAPRQPPPASAAAPEDLLLDALGWEPTTLDALQQRLGWPVDRLLARLLELELDGQLRAIDGGRYERHAPR